MRRVCRLPVVAAVCALAVVPLSGCGSEEPAGVDIAAAAQATEQRGTAQMTMTIRVTGMGLRQPVTMRADGVTALDKPQADIELDLDELVEEIGLEEVENVKIRLDGSQLYAKVPKLPGVDLPSEWLAIDLRALATGLGLDAEALGLLFNVAPASQLKAVRAAKDLRQVGTDEIDGVQTEHYEGTIRASEYIATLPAEQRARVGKEIEKLDRLAGATDAADSIDAPTPTELWIDEDGVIRRQRMSSTMPAQQGMPRGSVNVTYELAGFGAELDVSRPDRAKDLTRELTKQLSAEEASAQAQR